MSGFSPAWLDLREPIDVASRCVDLVEGLAQKLNTPEPIRVLDLGAGTGANLRYLAPRLGGKQDWRLLDNDDDLLAWLPRRLREWADEANLVMEQQNRDIVVGGNDFECRVRWQNVDISCALRISHEESPSLVTASALLDLVSESWLRQLGSQCHEMGAAVYFSLTYDGRIQIRPQRPDDEHVRELVNCHQLSDKGFGVALGPDAVAMTREVFDGYGYHLETGGSDWCLGPAEGGLSGGLIDGWLAAATEIAPQERAALLEWGSDRRRALDQPNAAIVVGHTDIVGWLP